MELWGGWWIVMNQITASRWTISSIVYMAISHQTSVCSSSLLLIDRIVRRRMDAWCLQGVQWDGGGGHLILRSQWVGGHSIQGVTHSSDCIVRSQQNAYVLSGEHVCYAMQAKQHYNSLSSAKLNLDLSSNRKNLPCDQFAVTATLFTPTY